MEPQQRVRSRLAAVWPCPEVRHYLYLHCSNLWRMERLERLEHLCEVITISGLSSLESHNDVSAFAQILITILALLSQNIYSKKRISNPLFELILSISRNNLSFIPSLPGYNFLILFLIKLYEMKSDRY